MIMNHFSCRHQTYSLIEQEARLVRFSDVEASKQQEVTDLSNKLKETQSSLEHTEDVENQVDTAVSTANNDLAKAKQNLLDAAQRLATGEFRLLTDTSTDPDTARTPEEAMNEINGRFLNTRLQFKLSADGKSLVINTDKPKDGGGDLGKRYDKFADGMPDDLKPIVKAAFDKMDPKMQERVLSWGEKAKTLDQAAVNAVMKLLPLLQQPGALKVDLGRYLKADKAAQEKMTAKLTDAEKSTIEDLTASCIKLTQDARNSVVELQAMARDVSKNEKDPGAILGDMPKEEQDKLVSAAKKDLDGTKWNDMKEIDIDKKVGMVMFTHGVSVTVDKQGDKVNISPPKNNLTVWLNKLGGLMMLVKAYFKADKYPEEKKKDDKTEKPPTGPDGKPLAPAPTPDAAANKPTETPEMQNKKKGVESMLASGLIIEPKPTADDADAKEYRVLIRGEYKGGYALPIMKFNGKSWEVTQVGRSAVPYSVDKNATGGALLPADKDFHEKMNALMLKMTDGNAAVARNEREQKTRETIDRRATKMKDMVSENPQRYALLGFVEGLNVVKTGSIKLDEADYDVANKNCSALVQKIEKALATDGKLGINTFGMELSGDVLQAGKAGDWTYANAINNWGAMLRSDRPDNAISAFRNLKTVSGDTGQTTLKKVQEYLDALDQRDKMPIKPGAK